MSLLSRLCVLARYIKSEEIPFQVDPAQEKVVHVPLEVDGQTFHITALSMGGPGTSAVYAWPSFSLYRIGSLSIFADPVEVPLDPDHRQGPAVPSTTVPVSISRERPRAAHAPRTAIDVDIEREVDLPVGRVDIFRDKIQRFAQGPVRGILVSAGKAAVTCHIRIQNRGKPAR